MDYEAAIATFFTRAPEGTTVPPAVVRGGPARQLRATSSSDSVTPSAAVRLISPTVSASAGAVTAVCTDELTRNRPNRRLSPNSPRIP